MTRRILSTALVSAAAVRRCARHSRDRGRSYGYADGVVLAGRGGDAARRPTPAAGARPRPRPRRPRRRPRTRRRPPRPTETRHATAPTETPFPSPVETTIETPAPRARRPTAARPTATATATRRRRRSQAQPRSAPPTARSAKNGQARECTEKNTGKASTSTSASGCVEVKEPKHVDPGRACAEAHKRRRQPRHVEPELLARGPGPGEDRRAELLHRQVPDSSVPAPDLPGRRHAVRRPLGDPRGHQRDRDRLRPQPQRLLRRRAGLDAVHARHVEGLRRRRQPRRRQGPVQPGRRDLRRRALPQGRRRRHRHPQGRLRLQPRRLVRRLAS